MGSDRRLDISNDVVWCEANVPTVEYTAHTESIPGDRSDWTRNSQSPELATGYTEPVLVCQGGG